jgi:hypothetical protein
MRVLKEGREREEWTDRIGAGRSEIGFGVTETWFGERSKFKLAGARLLAILGGWVGNDVMKLAAGSIYSTRKRWLEISTGIARRSEGQGGTARINSCLSSWRPHRRQWDDPRESLRRGGKAEPRGTRPRGGASPASQSAQPQSRRVRRWVTGVTSSRRATTRQTYLVTDDVNCNGGGVNLCAERSPAARIWRWQSDLYRATVPSKWDSVGLTVNI